MEFPQINHSFGGLRSSDDSHSVDLISIKYNHYEEEFEAKVLLKTSQTVDLRTVELLSEKLIFDIKNTDNDGDSDITLTPPSALN